LAQVAPEHWHFQPAAPLAGKTLGLFGFGGIAQRVARVALAMDMEVLALRRQSAPSPLAGVEMVHSLSDLMAASDHLVVAAPATDATHHAINAETLRLLRPGAHLVNIARGSLVDQEALRVALDNGTVARASLDVTDPEPLPAGHWLYSHPQVFLTPHASWVGPPALRDLHPVLLRQPPAILGRGAAARPRGPGRLLRGGDRVAGPGAHRAVCLLTEGDAQLVPWQPARRWLPRTGERPWVSKTLVSSAAA
jgi:phosphoglycerate dehydrogenase-like enzyme